MAIGTHVIDYINRHLRTAGWHAAQMRTGVEIQTKSAVDDFVTQADTEIDVMLSAALAALLPDCAVLSENATLTDGLITEESMARLSPAVARAVAARQRVWYLDTIDGTDNYVKEDGQYAVMLGLVVGGEPVYGWVYAPARDEIYFGGPPSEATTSCAYAGLWRQSANGPPAQLTSVSRSQGRTATDYLRVIMGSRDQRDNPHMVARLQANEWVAMGSIGLKVLAIINGAADVYIHGSRQLKFWDTAAPVALAKAAGLTVCDLHGEPLHFQVLEEGADAEIFRHRQTVLIGTAEGVAAARSRLI